MHGFRRKLQMCSNLVAENITHTNQCASKTCAPPDTREHLHGTSLYWYCAWYGVVGSKTLCSSCSTKSLFSICRSIGLWKSWFCVSATTMEGTGFTEGSKSVDFAGKPCSPISHENTLASIPLISRLHRNPQLHLSSQSGLFFHNQVELKCRSNHIQLPSRSWVAFGLWCT